MLLVDGTYSSYSSCNAYMLNDLYVQKITITRDAFLCITLYRIRNITVEVEERVV